MAKDAPASALGLRGIALLEGLPEARLADLAQRCAWRRYDSGQHIISRDSPDRDVYLLVAGRVRITIYSASGRQVTFRDERAGALLGDVSALDGRPRSADAVALESVLAASLPPGAFRELLREEPALAERELRRLAGLIRGLSERVIELSTLGVQNRIHAELLRLARESGVEGNRARIDPAPRHADVASQVSTYREQVTRELSALARLGIVAKDGTALVVPDVERLARMVRDVQSGA